jgi:hypothetical protein
MAGESKGFVRQEGYSRRRCSMCVFTLLLATLLLAVPAGNAKEKDAPPGEPPQLWLASASRQDGQVVIQIARPVERGGTDLAGLGPDVGSLPATVVMTGPPSKDWTCRWSSAVTLTCRLTGRSDAFAL